MLIEKIAHSKMICVARSLLATSTLITLVFNDFHDLFPVYHIEKIRDNSSVLLKFNFFLWFENLAIPRFMSIFVLLSVILGFIPRVLCFLHSWVAYSVFYSMLIVEGGDQINCILTLLLIPICVVDTRINSWKSHGRYLNKVSNLLLFNAKISLLLIKLQMSYLYLDASVSKLFVREWSNGTAMYYWFYDDIFGAPIYLQNSLGFLFKNNYSISLISIGVIALEFILFLAVLFKQCYKYLFFALGIIFHFIIVLVHGLPSFFLAMSAGLMLYLLRLDKTLVHNFRQIKKFKFLNDVKKRI